MDYRFATRNSDCKPLTGLLMKQLTLALCCLLAFGALALAQSPASQSPFTDLIKSAGDKSDYEGQDVVLVFDSTWVDVEETGLSHKTCADADQKF